MKNILKLVAVSFVVTALMSLNACSTVKGFGKDVSTTGKVIQRAA